MPFLFFSNECYQSFVHFIRTRSIILEDRDGGRCGNGGGLNHFSGYSGDFSFYSEGNGASEGFRRVFIKFTQAALL